MATEATASAAGEIREDTHRRAKLGMWVFLSSEVLFFLGLFLLYVTYRGEYSQAFHETAAGEMQVLKGTLNTFVLLTSSATMALAITAMQLGRIRWSVRLQLATAVLGMTFLAVKYLEW
ncbi:MAG: cytochrome c oxidase subunit 3, partial [Proteobacteria bacterium]|nr:cytochrome c oxidase subunit 3 [Pseudomonadota bacterium]